MSDLHLISHHLCPYVQRAVIVLLEKEVPHKRTYIDLANKPDWFLAASPLGQVPVLQTQGRTLFESQVIAEYLDEVTPGSLHPADPLQKARHRAWIEFGSETLKSVAGFYMAKDVEKFEKSRQTLKDKFARIETEIEGPFFGGKEFHLIDGVFGTIFRYFDVFDEITDFEILDGLPKVAEWRKMVMARPSVIAAVPKGYHERLHEFLLRKESHITGFLVKPEKYEELATADYSA